MYVYLLRHGDALQLPSLNDSERPLSELGEKQIRTAGVFLQACRAEIDAVYSSPLERAVQTAGIISSLLNIRKVERTEYLLPGTRKSLLLDFVNSNSPKSVLLAGHEPHLSQTLSLLISGREDLQIEIKKGSLASVVASDPLRGGHAMLQWLLSYEQMEALHH